MELLHSGISVIFVSHNMPLISTMTSRCIYLSQGNIVDIGPSDKITSLYLSDSIKKMGSDYQDFKESPMRSAYSTTPDFILENVIFMNQDGVEKDDFSTFQDIKMHFHVRFSKNIKDVSFAISVRSQLDDVVIAFNKASEKQEFERGSANIECLILKNTFREGCYNVGFYASTLTSGALFKSNHVKSFNIMADIATIKASGSSRGYTVINTKWDFL